MPFYNFWALNSKNATVCSTIVANSTEDARFRLVTYGFKPFTIQRCWLLFFYKVTDNDRIHLCTMLHDLMEAGLTLTEAMYAIARDKTKRGLHALYQTFADGLAFGLSTKAFAVKDFFDPIAFECLQRAEKTGNIKEALAMLAARYRTRQSLRESLFQSLRYPLVLFCVLVILCIVFSLTVLPQLNALSTQENWALKSLRSLLWVGPSIIAICGVIGLFFYRSPHFLLRFKLLKRLVLYRLWENLDFCLSNQLTLIESLTIVAQTQGPLLRHIPLSMRQHLSRGQSLQAAFSLVPHDSTVITSLIETSSQTGRINEAVSKIYQLETKFKKNLLNNIMYWTQPLLIFIMGLGLLWILLAVLLPLYDGLAEIQY